MDTTSDTVDINVDDNVCADEFSQCSLRAAIQQANALPGPDKIILGAAEYKLNTPKVTFDSVMDGDLDITDDLTILGAGAALTIIDGGNLDRVFNIYQKSSVVIRNVTIRNGTTGLLFREIIDYGGGIRVKNTSSLEISDCVIENNRSKQGAGIYIHSGAIENSVSSANIDNCVISNNKADEDGGGIRINAFSLATITRSVISGNEAQQRGGGLVHSFGAVTDISGTTIANNKAKQGGGIVLTDGNSVLYMNNSTISSNVATESGGGIYSVHSNAIFDIASSTISNNRALEREGGGIVYKDGRMTIRNSIVAGNRDNAGAPDCAGLVTSQGYNLLGNGEGCNYIASSGDVIGTSAAPVNALLAPLTNNGGTTPTHALLPDSPALNAASPLPPGIGANSCETNDQRAFSRIEGGVCDIGAYELINAAPEIFLSSLIVPITDDKPTALLPGIVLRDIDDNMLKSAVLRIVEGYVSGEEMLSMPASQKISANWDAESGVLSLTGYDTLTSYQSVLRSIRYQYTGAPADYNEHRLEISVSDPYQKSAPAVVSVQFNEPAADESDNDKDNPDQDSLINALQNSNENVNNLNSSSRIGGTAGGEFETGDLAGEQMNLDDSIANSLISLNMDAFLGSNKWLHDYDSSDHVDIYNHAIKPGSIFVAGVIGILGGYIVLGSLFGFLFSFPLWTRFDPVPVLAMAKAERMRKHNDAIIELHSEDADGRIGKALNDARPDASETPEDKHS